MKQDESVSATTASAIPGPTTGSACRPSLKSWPNWRSRAAIRARRFRRPASPRASGRWPTSRSAWCGVSTRTGLVPVSEMGDRFRLRSALGCAVRSGGARQGARGGRRTAADRADPASHRRPPCGTGRDVPIDRPVSAGTPAPGTPARPPSGRRVSQSPTAPRTLSVGNRSHRRFDGTCPARPRLRPVAARRAVHRVPPRRQRFLKFKPVLRATSASLLTVFGGRIARTTDFTRCRAVGLSCSVTAFQCT